MNDNLPPGDTPIALVSVPRTPKRAFDTNRPASTLIRSQIEQLQAAEAERAGAARPKRRRIRTEGQAARYIAEATRRLQAPPGNDAAAAAPPGTAPAPRPRRRRAATRRRAKPRATTRRRTTAARRGRRRRQK